MPKAAFILFFLLVISVAFEFLPFIDQARRAFPENFDGLSCQDVLKNRPLYGRINPWLWFWLASTPIILFSLGPRAPAWHRAFRILFSIGLGYVVINLGTHAAIEIRNAPFHGEGVVYSDGILITSEADKAKLKCFDFADGANFLFALWFGWIYALVYTGWWEIIWGIYQKRKTKWINQNFRRDWISLIVIFISMAITVFVAGLIIAKFFAG